VVQIIFLFPKENREGREKKRREKKGRGGPTNKKGHQTAINCISSVPKRKRSGKKRGGGEKKKKKGIGSSC